MWLWIRGNWNFIVSDGESKRWFSSHFSSYKERMEVFYESNPRFALCNANHVNIFDYTSEELCKIGKMVLDEQQY
jgi:hypothetical protein